MRKTGVGVAGFVLTFTAFVSGCSGTPEPEGSPSTANEPQVEEAGTLEQTEPGTLAEKRRAYCADYEAIRDDYSDFFIRLAETGNYDLNDWLHLDSSLSSLDASGLGSDWEVTHVKYISVYLQIKEAIEGDGRLSFNFDDYTDSLSDIIFSCLDASLDSEFN